MPVLQNMSTPQAYNVARKQVRTHARTHWQASAHENTNMARTHAPPTAPCVCARACASACVRAYAFARACVRARAWATVAVAVEAFEEGVEQRLDRMLVLELEMRIILSLYFIYTYIYIHNVSMHISKGKYTIYNHDVYVMYTYDLTLNVCVYGFVCRVVRSSSTERKCSGEDGE